MIKLILASLLFIVGMTAAKTQTAKINIDINKEISEINPLIYGMFMEPVITDPGTLGRKDIPKINTLYGTLYDPYSPNANEYGFRKEFIAAAKELKVTALRWPGGNYVSAYTWQDGIGPKKNRPVHKDVIWGVTDSNQVGTDEWVQLAKLIDAENGVSLNFGTGTLNDARYWIEYCNLPAGYYYSDLRAKYGHPKPYGIKYWFLGNEVDGEPWIIGFKNAEDYCAQAIDAARILKANDSLIYLIGSGSSYYDPIKANWSDWNLKVITGLRDVIDYISIHRYWEQAEDYYIYMGERAMDLEEKITTTAKQISEVREKYKIKKPIYIAMGEWQPIGKDILQVLALSQFMNSFIRHADVVKMTNFSMLTYILGLDKQKRTFKSPLFHTYKLFSNNCRGISINAEYECELFDAGMYKNIPYLDVTVVYNDSINSLVINVVNRHKTNDISTIITNKSGSLSGKAKISEINRKDLYGIFTYAEQEQYFPKTKDLTVIGNAINYSFPAHSYTQIIVGVKK